MPETASRKAYAICSSVNLDFFIASLSVRSGGAPRSYLTSSFELTVDLGETSVGRVPRCLRCQDDPRQEVRSWFWTMQSGERLKLGR